MTTSELASYFTEAHFIPQLKSDSKDAALEELLGPLVVESRLKSKEPVLTTLKQREMLGSTGIGNQVAIPHCRTLSVSEINVVVGLSESGIDFEAMDGDKAHLFFLILAPPLEESNNYLPILGKICELARDKKLRDKMIHSQDHETFVQLIHGGR